MKQTTLTIGIPALNEGKNIQHLLKEILAQDFSGLKLDKIIVISDGSTDNTVSQVLKLKNKKIHLIDGKERLGKNSRLNEITKMSNSNVLVFFDGDIAIKDVNLIKKLTAPVISDKAELTSCEIYEASPRTVVEKSLQISMKLKKLLFYEFKNGNNVYNCHGPSRAFSKKFYKKIKFTNKNTDDMYSYLDCIKTGFRFSFVRKSGVFYRLPNNTEDHYKQSSRFFDEKERSSKLFGKEFVREQFNIPWTIIIRASINSFGLIVVNLPYIGLYLVILALVSIGRKANFKVGERWQISSTKIVL